MSKVAPVADSVQLFEELSEEEELPPSTKKTFAKTVDTELPIDNARLKLSKSNFYTVFVIISIIFAFSENIIIGYPPYGVNYVLQIVFLSISTGLFILGILVTYLVIEETESVPLSNIFDRLNACFDGEVYLEIIFLVIGWAAIFESPGVAAFRCLRILRFLWYSELFLNDSKEYAPGDGPEHHWVSPTKSAQLCLEYLEKLAEEVTSAASKGGLVILAVYFYVTYLAAVVCWNLKHDLAVNDEQVYPCETLTSCFITMMRLSLYDGTGFDYVWAVIADGSGGLGCFLIAYMCLAGIILLNGLIGVFGLAFQEVEDEEDEKEANKVEKGLEDAGIIVFPAPLTDQDVKNLSQKELLIQLTQSLNDLNKDYQNFKRKSKLTSHS